MDFSDLSKLNLSKLAIACYASLYNDGPTTLAELSQRLNHSRGAVYKTLSSLQAKGFVTSVKSSGQPTYFHAVKLDKALYNLAQYQQRAVASLISRERGW